MGSRTALVAVDKMPKVHVAPPSLTMFLRCSSSSKCRSPRMPQHENASLQRKMSRIMTPTPIMLLKATRLLFASQINIELPLVCTSGQHPFAQLYPRRTPRRTFLEAFSCIAQQDLPTLIAVCGFVQNVHFQHS